MKEGGFAFDVVCLFKLKSVECLHFRFQYACQIIEFLFFVNQTFSRTRKKRRSLFIFLSMMMLEVLLKFVEVYDYLENYSIDFDDAVSKFPEMHKYLKTKKNNKVHK